jgi:hypothetical protein
MLVVAVVSGCHRGGTKQTFVDEMKIDSCLSICSEPNCLKSLTHVVGGGQIKLQGDEPSSPDPWLNIPDSALDNFRLDFYDDDGQRVASVIQKCPMKRPVKIDSRVILNRNPSGTYFMNLSRNGVPIGTAKYLWRR